MIFINKIKTTECIFTTKNFRIQNKTKNKKKMHSEKKKYEETNRLLHLMSQKICVNIFIFLGHINLKVLNINLYHLYILICI